LYRLADAGKTVLVLERGAAYPPDAFPRTPQAFAGNFWNPGRKSFGLFEVRSFSHIDTMVSAGLGGGSLIYADVRIRKVENWFETEADGHSRPWPGDACRTERGVAELSAPGNVRPACRGGLVVGSLVPIVSGGSIRRPSARGILFENRGLERGDRWSRRDAELVVEQVSQPRVAAQRVGL
jgi:choline dehydrogenase-like flavoprotein